MHEFIFICSLKLAKCGEDLVNRQEHLPFREEKVSLFRRFTESSGHGSDSDGSPDFLKTRGCVCSG